MAKVDKNFAQRLKYIRRRMGLTQEGLALICNIDRTYVGRLERMERAPSLGTIKKIADGLGVSMSELLDF